MILAFLDDVFLRHLFLFIDPLIRFFKFLITIPFLSEFLLFWISLCYLICCFFSTFNICSVLVLQKKDLQNYIYKSLQFILFINFYPLFFSIVPTQIWQNIVLGMAAALEEIEFPTSMEPTIAYIKGSFNVDLGLYYFDCTYIDSTHELLKGRTIRFEAVYGLFFDENITNNFFFMYVKMILFLLIFFCIKHWFEYININKYMWISINEFPFIFLGSSLFLVILLSINNLFLATLCIIGMSICFYVLLAINSKFGEIPREATIKYFILSALSSGLILGGLKELFLISGTLNFNSLNDFYFLLVTDNLYYKQVFTIKYAMILIFGGFLFKLSAAPSHFWAPEVYEGLPFSLITFIILPIKFAIGFLFLRIFKTVFTIFAFTGFDNFLLNCEIEIFLIITIICSMLIGGVNAIFEQKLKRFIAYSSINQIGFLFIGLLGFNSSLQAIQAFIYFFFVYALNLVMFFTIIFIFMRFNFASIVVTQNQQITTSFLNLVFITDFQKIFNTVLLNVTINKNILLFTEAKIKNSLYLLLFIIVLFSLAGIPPLIGFFGKFYILLYIFKLKYFFILFISIFVSIISVYYYLKFLKVIFFEESILLKKNIEFCYISKHKNLFFERNLDIFFFFLFCFLSFISPIFLDSLFLNQTFKLAQSFFIFLN